MANASERILTRLRARLASRGAQAEFARKTGTPPSWISQMLKRGKGLDALDTVDILANGLGLDVKELLTEVTEVPGGTPGNTGFSTDSLDSDQNGHTRGKRSAHKPREHSKNDDDIASPVEARLLKDHRAALEHATGELDRIAAEAAAASLWAEHLAAGAEGVAPKHKGSRQTRKGSGRPAGGRRRPGHGRKAG